MSFILLILGCGTEIYRQSEVFMLPFDKVVADIEKGLLELTEVDSEVIDVEHVREWSRSEPEWRVEIVDRVLYIESSCPAKGYCTHDFIVPAMADTKLHAYLGDGTVTLYGMGETHLRCELCDVELSDTTGVIEIWMAEGSVTGHSMENTIVDVEGSDASFDIECLDPVRIGLETEKGDINLSVPGGSYVVDTEPNAELLGVNNDPDATTSIRALTGSGDVRITAILE